VDRCGALILSFKLEIGEASHGGFYRSAAERRRLTQEAKAIDNANRIPIVIN
jgi:hypothetical protein